MECAALYPEMQHLQPFVLLRDGIYVKGRREHGAVRMVTALGVVHALRRLASFRVWQEHCAGIAADEFVRRAIADVSGSRAKSAGNVLTYFLHVILPRFERHDWGERAVTQYSAPPAPPPPDLSAAVRAIPAPALPTPSLLILGRLWLLTEARTPRGVHIRLGPEVLVPTGEFVPLGRLTAQWSVAVEQFAREWVSGYIENGVPARADAAQALDEFRRTGALERGDLVLLNTTPPRLGHIVPQHVNRTLRRTSTRDLLLTAVVTVPARGDGPGGLSVFGRDPGGAWAPVALPNGLCLGSGPPVRPSGLDDDLLLPGYLRWGATRIAVNGRFHVSDR